MKTIYRLGFLVFCFCLFAPAPVNASKFYWNVSLSEPKYQTSTGDEFNDRVVKTIREKSFKFSGWECKIEIPEETKILLGDETTYMGFGYINCSFRGKPEMKLTTGAACVFPPSEPGEEKGVSGFDLTVANKHYAVVMECRDKPYK